VYKGDTPASSSSQFSIGATSAARLGANVAAPSSRMAIGSLSSPASCRWPDRLPPRPRCPRTLPSYWNRLASSSARGRSPFPFARLDSTDMPNTYETLRHIAIEATSREPDVDCRRGEHLHAGPPIHQQRTGETNMQDWLELVYEFGLRLRSATTVTCKS